MDDFQVLRQYKVQPGTNEPLDGEKLKWCENAFCRMDVMLKCQHSWCIYDFQQLIKMFQEAAENHHIELVYNQPGILNEEMKMWRKNTSFQVFSYGFYRLHVLRGIPDVATLPSFHR